ncbi:hypothetical protein Nepgr_025154 [Nepenthes gracilis]|uniref:RRM domain-containing protein n=1 Tax=Nepenthes gracilis TaxID=150966 RepID=A0AAD3Y174_NEPGR|nr:hypothetical protein Nepgr_025154 [Nepenthes gracilis]
MNAIMFDEKLDLFHHINRALYAILVFNLFRDPIESMHVLSLFLWLERQACCFDLINNILPLSLTVVNMLADEAVVCLNLITKCPFDASSSNIDIPMIRAFSRRDIPLNYVHDNKDGTIEKMAKYVADIYIRVLKDLMEQVIERNNNLLISADVIEIPRPFDMVREAVVEVHPDDRTMFVTFSKEYPMSKEEVIEFFTTIYGECIEFVQMQDVQANEQPLFARIVVNSASKVKLILQGAEKMKFTINGKHVWVRKFVPKRPRSQPAPGHPLAAWPGSLPPHNGFSVGKKHC